MLYFYQYIYLSLKENVVAFYYLFTNEEVCKGVIWFGIFLWLHQRNCGYNIYMAKCQGLNTRLRLQYSSNSKTLPEFIFIHSLHCGRCIGVKQIIWKKSSVYRENTLWNGYLGEKKWKLLHSLCNCWINQLQNFMEAVNLVFCLCFDQKFSFHIQR